MATGTRAPRATPSEPFTIHSSLLFDPTTKAFLPNRSITVSPATGLIIKAYSRQDNSPIAEHDIDLRHLPLVLPGLVDAHTHIFLYAYSEASATTQMRYKSPVERTIRAVNYIRNALLATVLGCAPDIF